VILNVRKDDQVMIMRGDDKGKKGKVLRTIPGKHQVIVQSVNYVWRHLKRSQQNPQGGRIQKEAPIPVAAVMVVCGTCNEPTRIYRKREERGHRFCHRCDKPVGTAK
jgi:large subunit ribosomal protein L24